MSLQETDGQRTIRLPVADRRKIATIVVAVLAGSLVLFVCDPAKSSFFPSCLFHAATGFHCPGCGTLRALHQLLHGNLLAALSLNPLMMICLPFIAYSFLLDALQTMTGRPVRRPFVSAAWIWTLLVVVVLFWILRNLPVYPFTLLAP